MVAVFLLRVDTVTNRPEGEVYYINRSGYIHCNFWKSPKLVDHEVIIASGKKEIADVFEKYKKYHITETSNKSLV